MARRTRFSDTEPLVPRVWAKRLTRSSSTIQPMSVTSGAARRATPLGTARPVARASGGVAVHEDRDEH